MEPILLYNSETWALTSTLANEVDAFHRRLLRISINIRYPKLISDKKLYTLTKEPLLSEKIQKRRLKLLGHILRLHQETPAQKALNFYVTPHPRPVGRPILTWITLIIKYLQKTLITHNIKTPLTVSSLEKLKFLAKDKNLWRMEITRNK